MTLAKPKLGVTEQVIAEQVLLDSAVDGPFHHFTDDREDTDGAVIGWVGFVLFLVYRTYLGNFPHCRVVWLTQGHTLINRATKAGIILPSC